MFGTDAYEQGYHAYKEEGDSINPYFPYTVQWSDWNAGWLQAYLDDGEEAC